MESTDFPKFGHLNLYAHTSHMLSEQDLENQSCIILNVHLPLHTHNVLEGDGVSAAFVMQFSNTYNRCTAVQD